jgi:antibiotic biosynthesis monooxygenase (ABM) superfamily enzyme
MRSGTAEISVVSRDSKGADNWWAAKPVPMPSLQSLLSVRVSLGLNLLSIILTVCIGPQVGALWNFFLIRCSCSVGSKLLIKQKIEILFA